MTQARVAVDIGGTFTDLVHYDDGTRALTVSKVLTDVEDRSRGVIQALAGAGEQPARRLRDFVHGTTAATNAVIEGATAPTALITTEGFRDVLELMRGDRPLPVYDINWRKPDALIPRSRRFEVRERLGADGRVVTPLDEAQLRALVTGEEFAGIEAVAVCFMHAFLNDAHERRAGEIIAEARPDLFVSLSCEVDPEVREYERTSTVALDAMLKPMMSTYLRRLETGLDDFGVSSDVLVMLANAGVMSIAAAESRPLFTLHSGPAGGVVGAAALGRALGRSHLITADMGGTSFDVCAIVDGAPRFRTEGLIRWGVPFRMPLVDVGTIGAGGGSVGWIDAGGLLRVGPRSAGADPGPACYGRGGEEATITDAFAVLGYFGDRPLGGGAMTLEPDLAHAAMGRLAARIGQTPEYVADGMLQIATANMAGEIRKNSVERGDDPREFSLFSFGGAGAMFAGRLARELGMRDVIVPPFAGVFSALGMLGADLRFDVHRTFYGELGTLDLDALEAAFRDAEATALAEFANPRDDIRVARALALRYVGQRHELQVPLAGARTRPERLAEARAAFDRAHRLNYGHDRPGDLVELRGISVTATVERPSPVLSHAGADTPEAARTDRRRVRLIGEPEATGVDVFDRTRLAAGISVAGPAIFESDDSTTVVYPGQRATVHRSGAIVIEEAG